MKKKIVLIGPVYPYKGGISHYTGMMFRALAEEYDVKMVSFKMQYPKFLFKKEQKDYSNDRFKINDTNYWLNTANPFNIAATAQKIRREKPDAVILQWWHPYFAPCYWLLSHFLGKCKVIFICHNVFPHERFPLDRFLTKLTLRRGDGFIVQSHQDEDDLCAILPGARHILTPHPTYNAFKIRNITMEGGRAQLQMPPDVPMLLFFGFIREYKGLRHLLKAMPTIRKALKQAVLWVVGDFGGEESKASYLQLIEQLELGDSIRLVEGYVPDEEVEKYFAAADLVICPYESATQSGIVQIAYGFEKPVVVTDVGGLPDVVIDEKTGYVVPNKDSEAIAKAVIRFFSENRAAVFAGHIREEAYKYSWDRMREQIGNLVFAK